MLAGAVVVVASNGDTPKLEDYELVPGEDGLVEILDSGFNPEACTFSVSNRGFDVYWVNSTDEPKQVVSPVNPYFNTGVIQPGELSKSVSFDFTGSNHYHLEGDPNVTGVVRESSSTSCVPQPPTPTPTNTPTITPTPTHTPAPTSTPTMIPTPEGQQGHVPLIAREAEYPY